MKKYKAAAVIFLHTGKVALTEAQAKRRKYCVRHLEGDVYEITSPVCFKAGEQFSYDGELNRAMAAEMVLVHEAAPAGDAPVEKQDAQPALEPVPGQTGKKRFGRK